MDTPVITLPVLPKKKGRKKKITETPTLVIQQGEFIVSFK
jgi:hypothetical protein